MIFAHNELCQNLLRELREVLDVTRRVSKAMGLLQKRGAVRGRKDSWGGKLGG